MSRRSKFTVLVNTMSLNTVSKQVKYGLISKKPSAPPAQIKPRLSMFDRDDSDDDNSTATNDVSRVNAQLAKRNTVLEQTMSAAVNAEPDIYDYDGAYDSFKAKEQAKHSLSQPIATKDAPKARYVSNLLATSKMREKEKERVFEKNLLKERKVEDVEFGDKDKFITAAYKKKLLEDKKWEYEDRLADEVEQRTDVRKSGMEGFYANLLTKNVAMGGDVDAHAVSVYTAGSARQSHVLQEPAPAQDAEKKSLKFDHRAASSSSSIGDKSEEPNEVVDPAESSRYLDKSKKESVRSSEARQGEEKSEPIRKMPRSEDTSPHEEDNAATAVPAKIVPVATIIDKKEQIMSAKDRYLARKRALEA